jgi:hypothetical protein
MNSAPDRSFGVFNDVDALPDDALALFGSGLFDSRAWYRVVTDNALPAGAKPVFLVIGTPATALFPMRAGPGRAAGALTTPYTCLWAPLSHPGATAAELWTAGRALSTWCKPHGAVRLDALDLSDPRWPDLRAGIRAGGMLPLTFDHFGNWHTDVTGLDFPAYLAARPGAVRSTLKRRGDRLAADGAALRVITGGAALPGAIATYQSVYDRSWKSEEPYPKFNPALMRACAADGSLRLGLLERGGTVLAAQFWVVRNGTATVLKLAYDTAEKASSPGTVLTGLMIKHLMTQETLTGLDFGRGDDSYKRDWTGSRRQRSGLVLANPRDPAGLMAIARHAAGRMRALVLAR